MTPPALPKSALTDPKHLRAAADRCVMCGMCLPHCPTYVQMRNEAESPRGRISLIRALADGGLAPSAALAAHLNSCLTCRACEAVCPSEVEYGQLIDGGRALLRAETATRPSLATRLLLRASLGRHRLDLLAAAGWATQRLGLLRLLRRTPARRLQTLLPPLRAPRRWRREYAPPGEARGTVALFTGCLARVVDRETLEASIALLTHLGYRVALPKEQVCCGALHQHTGDLATAQRLQQENLAAFAGPEFEAIIHTATGCGAQLVEYPDAAFGHRLQDISAFVVAQCRQQRPTFSALAKRIAVHEPCTQRNVLRQGRTTYDLLALVPELQAVPLPGNNRCCGAAGSYMLDFPEMADTLRAEKLTALEELGVSTLVSANVGCALHLAAGARERGMKLDVIHPITLLARQLPR